MKNILLLLCLSTLALSQNKAEENSRSAIFPFGAQQSIATELLINNLGAILPSPRATPEGPCKALKTKIWMQDNTGTYHTTAAVDDTNYSGKPTAPYGNLLFCRGIWIDDFDRATPVTGHVYFTDVAHLFGNRNIQNAMAIFQHEAPTDTGAHGGDNNNALYVEQVFDGTPSDVSGLTIAALRVNETSYWNASAPSHTSAGLIAYDSLVQQGSSSNDYDYSYMAEMGGVVENLFSGATFPVYGLNPQIRCGGTANDCAVVGGSIVGPSSGIKAMVVEQDTGGETYGIYQKGVNDPNQFGAISTHSITVAPVAFAALPGCGANTEGMERAITDSTTNTWGATISGGGSSHVKAYCDGTAWTVEAK